MFMHFIDLEHGRNLAERAALGLPCKSSRAILIPLLHLSYLIALKDSLSIDGTIFQVRMEYQSLQFERSKWVCTPRAAPSNENLDGGGPGEDATEISSN